MGEQARSITTSTLLPIGLVVMLSGAVWSFAGDRASQAAAVVALEKRELAQDERIKTLEQRIEYLVAASYRMEAKLGTLPAGKVP